MGLRAVAGPPARMAQNDSKVLDIYLGAGLPDRLLTTI